MAGWTHQPKASYHPAVALTIRPWVTWAPGPAPSWPPPFRASISSPAALLLS